MTRFMIAMALILGSASVLSACDEYGTRGMHPSYYGNYGRYYDNPDRDSRRYRSGYDTRRFGRPDGFPYYGYRSPVYGYRSSGWPYYYRPSPYSYGFTYPGGGVYFWYGY